MTVTGSGLQSVLSEALKAIHIGITVSSVDGEILYTNRADAEMHGYAVEELRGKDARLFAPQQLWVPAKLKRLKIINTWHRESLNVRKDGTVFPVELCSDVLLDKTGAPIGIVTTCQNISERKSIEQELVRKALQDCLTGLPNRALFMDRLQHSLQRATRRRNHHFAVLFLDVDHFKQVNDSLGHLAGDELLRSIAERLVACLRPGDTVARIGGDEFTILLDELRDRKEAIEVARRIARDFRIPFPIDGLQVHASVSIGIAYNEKREVAPEELLRNADTALYRAKMNGRARHVVFTRAAMPA